MVSFTGFTGFSRFWRVLQVVEGLWLQVSAARFHWFYRFQQVSLVLQVSAGFGGFSRL